MSARPTFPPDEIELEIPDVASANELLRQKDPSFLRYVGLRRGQFERTFGEEHRELLDKTEGALKIAFARFARRHGTWGGDLHHYHNERHTVEIISDRIDYLCEKVGPHDLDPVDWILLTLFGAMHDLRQREKPDTDHIIGSNEQASIDESFRILEKVGMSRREHRDFFETLKMMIAGSTFNIAPKQNPNISPAEAATTAGALAPSLILEMDEKNPDWRSDPELKRRARLTLIASDLDTANVAEPVIRFAKSGVRLCKEIEYRCGRDMGLESAGPVFNFLTRGQEAYFFDLHQFDSKIGARVLGAMKEKNAPLIRTLCNHMREVYGEAPDETITGNEIVDEFMHKASELSGRATRM